MANPKSKSYALNGGHTAGIFADMSVDGPQIGTLVMIVDRAKNLPNRKTIGKQDPYCAARLGKEAKKTATDIRGGQTPKWDQELRFTVHDSPDYYQLKISVFTDDKKTDLIGDAWIDLKGIVLPGGGQGDIWQSLSCKGKYAGEIRVEITYYDSRPKPDKPVTVKRRQLQQAQPQPQKSPSLPDQDPMPRTPVKRRPLPSDPVTGEAPSPPPVNASPDHLHQTPPRPHVFVPTQSPLQAVEYNTPLQHAARQHSDPCSSGRVDGPRPVHRARDTSDPTHHDERGYDHKVPVSPYEPASPRGHHSPLPEHYHEMPAREEPRMDDDACPPPPPAHRSMPSGDSQELVHRVSYDATPQKTAPSTPMRHEVLRNEAHRHSAPSYPGRPIFKPYVPPSPPVLLDAHSASPLDPAPRYHSYESADDAHYRPMQATVEDAPESPPRARQASYGYAAARSRSHDEMMFEVSQRTESMDIRHSPGPSPHHANYPTGRYYQEDWPPAHAQSPSYNAHSPQGHDRIPRDGCGPSPRYELPDVPASLSPGLDPSLSREMSEQMLEERRNVAQYSPPPLATPSRSHKAASASYTPYAAGYTARPYDTSEKQLVRQSDVGRNAQHAIPRKSVSPGPPLAENRLLADTPYSPDSYDALNPVIGHERVEVGGKIITHDGREIDPSDHLPMESWAPEPEPKHPQASPEPRTRPSPSGAQPMPPNGRRPLRIAGAQPNMASPAPYKPSESPQTPSPRGGGDARGRLQKKTDRGRHWGHSSTSSSPLAPVSTDKLQGRQGRFTPGSGGERRWGSWDYSIENHAPQQGTSPPVTGKMALPMMSGGSGPGDLALMREMQGIDLGSGRSRRRGGGY
ncbi:hypothetical protein XA68_12865 [Ophiocordyceps unilateralis]|uniref:C2 domain-containing protein n=1 Tax=Ophiocordyceps unilateralis TaxID=268505 RepID=A0A2A9PNY8_OPHUN|nr:hypothetical protein XA68_12865 [Ophiocordyceps unilateralis]